MSARKPLTAEQKAKRAAYMREWSKNNEDYKAYRREYRQKNRDHINTITNAVLAEKRTDPEWMARDRERKTRWRANYRAKFTDAEWKERNRIRAAKYRCPEKRREMHLVAKFGLTQADWDAMFIAQGNACAICGSSEPKSKHGWHTDHCHTTGKVRGILCGHCNHILGRAFDNTTILKSAIKYLENAG